ncbi:MAG: hypothetical protein ABFS42_03925 [Candidatus Krumholzibacteriota bacterium]
MFKRIMFLTGLLIAVFAVNAMADEFVDTFDAGAGPWASPPWAYGTVPATGGAWDDGPYLSLTGNPMRTNPMPRTFAGGISPAEMFHGNYRLAGVTSVGVDVIVLAPAYAPYDMPGCLFFYSDLDNADGDDDQFWYYLTDKLPQPGDGWVSFDAPMDASSDTAPAGWLLGDATPGTPPPAANWSVAVQNVSMFGFYFGDFDGGGFGTQVGFTNVGCDNFRITYGSAPVGVEEESWGGVKALFR